MLGTSRKISAIWSIVALIEFLNLGYGSVPCNVINRVSAKLHCFTHFIFLCASYFLSSAALKTEH